MDTDPIINAENAIGPDIPEDMVPFPVIKFKTTGYIYQERRTDEQREFEENPAKFRAAQAAVGSGKSAMGTIEALRNSWYYRRNLGFIIRKTMPQAEISAIPDLLDITPQWMIINWSKQNKTLELLNQYGYQYMEEKGKYQKKKDWYAGLQDIGGTSLIVFTSFEGTQEALNKWESSNLGWYMIDQAEWGNEDIKKMLDHRLRRQPASRRAWFLANFRKDIPYQSEWLWRLFSEDSPEHLEDHWYTDKMTTASNSHNTPADWHESLKRTMTPEEQARYLEGDIEKMEMTKQVFDEFSLDTHVIEHQEPPLHWTKGVGLDPGFGNPTAFLQIAFSPAGDVYVYDEWEKPKHLVSEVATQLLLRKTPQHLYWYIDATAGNTHQSTGTSVLLDFIAHGLPFATAPRNVGAGVMRIKEYMKFDANHIHPFSGKRGAPRLLISEKCPILAKQLMLYRIDERKTHVGLANETEKFRQYMDHLVDALRFILMGATLPVGLKQKMKRLQGGASYPNGVPGTVIKQPDFIGTDGQLDFSRIAAQAMVPVKKHVTPRQVRTTPWSEVQRNSL